MNDNQNRLDKPNALTTTTHTHTPHTALKGFNTTVPFAFKPNPARKLVSWASLPRVDKESSNNKTTHPSTHKSQASHKENISSAITTKSNQQQSHHALQKQVWSNAASSRTTEVKPTSSALRSQGTTPLPSLFSFSPTFHTNVQRHPSTPLSTAVQMLPASASTKLEKSSISKKRHDKENSNPNPGTGLVRVKKEKPEYSSSKFKTVSFAMSPQPANNQLNHVSSTTAQPSTLAKSTNDESIPSCTLSTLPRSTTLISDDPVLLASSPTTTTPLTDHVPSIAHSVAEITNATSHKSNDSISSATAKPYTRQPPRSSTNNSLSLSVKEHGDRKKEASTTTSSISNQLHTEDVDKFAVFLKQTLAQKDAARTAAVEEINTLRGKLQSQEKIIAEYKVQFQRLDQVSTSLSGKQDDMGQGIQQLSSQYTLVKSMLEDLKQMIDNMQQSSTSSSMNETNTVAQFQDLIAKTTKLQDEQHQMTMKHMGDLEKAVSRNNAMSDRLYELYADMGSLRSKINHATETSARQRAYIAGTLTTIIEFETAHIKELRQEAGAIHDDMNTLSGHFSYIGHTIQSSKEASDLVKSKIGCLREKIVALEDMMAEEGNGCYVGMSNEAGMSALENSAAASRDRELDNLRFMVQKAQAEATRQSKLADDSAADGMRLLSEVAFLKAELETQKDRYDVLQESYDKREQERNAADSDKMVLRSTLKKRLNPEPELVSETADGSLSRLRRRKRRLLVPPTKKSQQLPAASNDLTESPGDIMEDIAMYIKKSNDESS
ncbi:hypothetical protein O0I10_010158 [Lichtheimia ornata]|uniref:Uncharacterized protein n=1 Tax=Lichtheimia ornata TaxID=688661 RepID=A0AAD7UXC2_9FUNG|nr:uncharacterized protein O0I10_010158 [Lichtheimia ornata]KAJ8654210.1 hypothetical protein O0I10_010158 [Lichtheimia ornata]